MVSRSISRSPSFQPHRCNTASCVLAADDVPKLPGGYLSGVLNRFYVPTLSHYYENRLVRRSFGWLYYRMVR